MIYSFKIVSSNFFHLISFFFFKEGEENIYKIEINITEDDTFEKILLFIIIDINKTRKTKRQYTIYQYSEYQ